MREYAKTDQEHKDNRAEKDLKLGANEFLRQAGYGSHGQELRGKDRYLFRNKGRACNIRRKTRKKPWRNFEAIPYEGHQHMQSIKEELKNA